jgi:hypothetical protein
MNLNNFYQFPSPFVFHTKVKGHDHIKATTLHKIIEVSDAKKEDVAYKWAEGCSSNMITNYTCKDYSVFSEELIRNAIVSPLEELSKYLQNNHSDVFATRVMNDIFNEDCDPGIAHIWWNVYEKGDFCPLHDHSGCISGIYVLHQDESDPLHFNHTNELGCYSYCSQASEGSVLLFPSSLSHFLYPVKTHRITISFNLVANQKQLPEEES